jgi:FtsZ-interacting cell division protein ZipA
VSALNPLFIALLIAGAVLVIGVVVVNWVQERRVRRRIDATFRKPATAARDADRVEPMLRGAASAGATSVAVQEPIAELAEEEALADVEGDIDALPEAPVHAEVDSIAPDADTELVIDLEPKQPVQKAALAEALAIRFGKPVRWLGKRAPGLPWQPLDSSSSGPWQVLAACFLLANRAGAATREHIDEFLGTMARFAAGLPSTISLPDAAGAAGRAEEIDRFCADLDVQIGLTVLKGDMGQIAGTRLRGVAEAAGFRLTPAGQFDFVDETGATLFSLQNYKQEPFMAESLRTLATPGVVFILDVPRVADPVRVFDQMRLAAKRMTHNLDCVLVDDNRRALTDASLGAIRGQVQATAAALRAAHIDPGGPRALRLFG